ncbi:MAG: hypothetical protein H0T73_08720 [Ardenticatenales bacterium]|nr:hypothetical protein [Ardenticatenales bacterium]
MKSVIALYDKVDKAQAAARALLTGGFSQSSIKLYVAAQDERNQALLAKTDYKIRLAGEGAKGLTHLYHMLMQLGVPEEEALLYCKEIETGRGNAFVAVHGQGEEVPRITETLNGFGPTVANNLVSHWRLPRIVYFPFSLQNTPLEDGALADRELRLMEESLARMIVPRVKISHLVFEEPIEEFSFIAPRLTPTYLRTILSPYLEALDDLQQLIDQMQGVEVASIRLLSITENSSVNVTVEGAIQVLQWLTETLLPWRAENMDKGKYQDPRALGRGEIELAFALVTHLAPWLSKAEKKNYVVRVIPALHVLLTSELSIRVEG